MVNSCVRNEHGINLRDSCIEEAYAMKRRNRILTLIDAEDEKEYRRKYMRVYRAIEKPKRPEEKELKVLLNRLKELINNVL